jgi:hypothetical protein
MTQSIHCEVCGYENQAAASTCSRCGTRLERTVSLKTKSLDDLPPETLERLRALQGKGSETIKTKNRKVMKSAPRFRPGTPIFEEGMALQLKVRDFEAPLMVTPRQQQELIVGRHRKDGRAPGIDLTPYNAHISGVSRQHAAITLVDKSLMLCDLNSTNGTFLNDIQLDPLEMHQLRDSDVIRLAQMVMVVQFVYE